MDYSSSNLFDVYLRLRPSYAGGSDRFLDVEPPDYDSFPKHISIKPPANDHRKRAVEKFAFTRVFEEDAGQVELFRGAGILQLLEGVLGTQEKSRDGLLATLGVTGSGKSHTILGSKSQRGLTQMALDVLFKSISNSIVHPTCANSVFPSLAASDVSEAQMFPAASFLDPSSENQSVRGSYARAQTPQIESSFLSAVNSKHRIPRASALPTYPSLEGLEAKIDPAYEYVIVVSMYEVYNDRIFDLLTGQATNTKHGAPRRRPLLFKSTELSPDRKVVAGLRKIVCCTLDEALLVLETGLLERKVAGTGSNAVSSRSHGFFSVEVKRRHRIHKGRWEGSALTIVDMAGSERARNAKTAGATLAEAGKINESLMYLGQCMQMQMQSDISDGHRKMVPFRQCKLTELLFSNSFPSTSNPSHKPTPQKAIMLVTADATGDFNATSQILRYSALAREVTVPRIPSITSTILHSGIPGTRPGSSGSSTGSGASNGSVELLAEVARLVDEVAVLSLQLEDEHNRREAAEDGWAACEAHVREQCWSEMEDIMESDRHRWQNALDEEAERDEERVDAKIEILARGAINDDESGLETSSGADRGKDEEFRILKEENDRLRAKIELMEREKLLKTPSGGKKQRIFKTRKWEAEEDFEANP